MKPVSFKFTDDIFVSPWEFSEDLSLLTHVSKEFKEPSREYAKEYRKELIEIFTDYLYLTFSKVTPLVPEFNVEELENIIQKGNVSEDILMNYFEKIGYLDDLNYHFKKYYKTNILERWSFQNFVNVVNQKVYTPKQYAESMLTFCIILLTNEILLKKYPECTYIFKCESKSVIEFLNKIQCDITSFQVDDKGYEELIDNFKSVITFLSDNIKNVVLY